MKIEVNVPTDWSDITIQQYKEYHENIVSDKTERKKLLDSVTILCGIKPEHLIRLSVKDVERLAVELKKITEYNPDKDELEQVVDFNGKQYGFIPNLSDMTTGEFIDLETYCNDNVLNNMEHIMSILYRPLVGPQDVYGRYEIEDYQPTESKAETMKQFPMSFTLSAISFFFHLGDRLLQDTNSCSKTTQKKKTKTTVLK